MQIHTAKIILYCEDRLIWSIENPQLPTCHRYRSFVSHAKLISLLYNIVSLKWTYLHGFTKLNIYKEHSLNHLNNRSSTQSC